MADYVTREELDNVLKGYEKLGAAERTVKSFDGQIRGWVTSWMEKKSLETISSLGDKLNLLNSKFDLRLKEALNQTYANATTETDSKIKTISEKTINAVTASTLATIKNKMSEVKDFAQETARIQCAESEKQFKNIADVMKAAIRSDISMFEESVKADTERQIKETSYSLENSLKQLVVNVITEEITYLKNLVKTFTEDLHSILSEKVIDKQMIEAKIADIEAQLASKAQSVINFNIEQARQQMEHAAKAEIQEGIKSASAQIFGAINIQ